MIDKYAVFCDTDAGTIKLQEFDSELKARLRAAELSIREDQRFQDANTRRPEGEKIPREAFHYYSHRKIDS